MAPKPNFMRGCQLGRGGWRERISIDTGDVRQTSADVFRGASELFQVASALASCDRGGLPALNFSTHAINSHMAAVRRGVERLGDEYSEYALWLRREAEYWERFDGGGWHPGAPWWWGIIPGEPRAPWEFPFFPWPSPGSIRPWPRPLPPGVCPTLPPKPKPPAPAPATPASAEAAAKWAEAHEGQVETSENPHSKYWSGYCETFVWAALGRPTQTFGSAFERFSAWEKAGRIQQGIPPRGAVVFYDYTDEAGNRYGHDGVSVGGGSVISTKGDEGEQKAVLRHGYNSRGLKYLGWAMP